MKLPIYLFGYNGTEMNARIHGSCFIVIFYVALRSVI